ncbi:MAG: CRISPR-associated protein, Cas6 family [Thermotoga sp. 50_1627]|uniref:CRISPR-associated endoribonuclease Cas6 n=1 Tax=Pseudothermotoga sp. TaxID=2033661 RepID=UPI00076D3B0E|nr:MAG: CRISPR-associated protein, Cas6 family [Thermotoga sp. 50_64]KUK25287.1 MAG: CRISPR-associated protein, Cas6 family [Thermotoga sp. 50_1627]MBC7116970.1 CRISPR-associated endoribonuclease Cas6 [Pseudothermotoga sp.]HBT39929.1 CRISPR-associated endoribonuclease Cas6 [Pseudothermotoga sp.]HCO97422.1 CRISPR-associated endoribonuclease Cas6 [Pseudothermotoga sp.]
MRVYINFEFDKLELPVEYNHILHAFVLNLIEDDELRYFIHEEGYRYQKRKYKMYCFSRLLGNFQLNQDRKTIKFHESVTLIVSSFDDNLIELLVDKLSRFETLHLGENKIRPSKITLFDLPPTNFIQVSTKSPVTVYSTIEERGKKITLYHNPESEDFIRILKENLKRKYLAIFGDESESNFDIEIQHVGEQPRKVVVVYKGTRISGWLTSFDLKGPYQILKLAYDTGIGSKNSIGFGCIELISSPLGRS